MKSRSKNLKKPKKKKKGKEYRKKEIKPSKAKMQPYGADVFTNVFGETKLLVLKKAVRNLQKCDNNASVGVLYSNKPFKV